MSSIKIRTKLKNKITTVKALINHPMETGMRKNKKTGKLIPAHFINHVTVTHKGNNILEAEWGTAVSKNPYLSFIFFGAEKGDEVKLSWSDNQGGSDRLVTKI